MDTNLTAQEEQAINTAIDNYGATKGLAEDDAKELFCEHWDMVKDVLEFLKDVLPAPIPAIIGIIVKVGDRFKQKNCPAA